MRFLTLVFASFLITGLSLDLDGCAANRPADNTKDVLASYEREMLQAVDAEKRYPYGAMDAHKQGSVTIDFDYTADGKADNLEVKKSSGDASLDHAALMTVYFAKLPVRPPELDGVDRFSVTVVYGFY